jgi:hypothetical protein
MSAKTYYEKLQDPRWQKLRLEAMQRAEFCCESCSDGKSTLNVHHKDYIKGREPWEYGSTQLSVLCESCHKEYHSKIDPIRFISTMLTLDGGPWDRNRIAFIISGYLQIDYKSFCEKLNYEQDDWSLSMYKLGAKLEEMESNLLKEIKNGMV